MTQSQPATNNSQLNNEPTFKPQKEIRFAVVFYGGISLAIYINGVTEELYNLVQATTPDDSKAGLMWKNDSDMLSGSAKVYRKLSQLLNIDINEHLKTKTVEQLLNDIENEPIHTRFIIDILSGTSAGGINGILLGKALANVQTFKNTKSFWVKEGGIERLINDKKSRKNVNIRLPDIQPLSLLNSQRYYYLLLKAIHEMDNEIAASSSNCVDELDLYITSTNIAGKTVPFNIQNALLEERQHRHVFHFRYDKGEGKNDFEKKYNPMLAFAARCTSSIPPAFEPMMIGDIEEILQRSHKAFDSAYKETFVMKGELKKTFQDQFFPGNKEYKSIAFGDGGYLDNKPFSYATETLLNRRADLPVDRKLIYVEPDPVEIREEPENNGRPGRPDMIKNITAALISLPGYETIREDIEKIKERNRVIEKINKIIAQREIDRLEDLKRTIQRERKISYLEYFKRIITSEKAWKSFISKAVWKNAKYKNDYMEVERKDVNYKELFLKVDWENYELKDVNWDEFKWEDSHWEDSNWEDVNWDEFELKDDNLDEFNLDDIGWDEFGWDEFDWDEYKWAGSSWGAEWEKNAWYEENEGWRLDDLGNDIDERGNAYGNYLVLRKDSEIERISTLIIKGLGLDERSHEYRIIYCLIEDWVNNNYPAYRKPGKEETINTYLSDFDVSWYFHRLQFIRKKINFFLAKESKDVIKSVLTFQKWFGMDEFDFSVKNIEEYLVDGGFNKSLYEYKKTFMDYLTCLNKMNLLICKLLQAVGSEIEVIEKVKVDDVIDNVFEDKDNKEIINILESYVEIDRDTIGSMLSSYKELISVFRKITFDKKLAKSRDIHSYFLKTERVEEKERFYDQFKIFINSVSDYTTPVMVCFSWTKCLVQKYSSRKGKKYVQTKKI